MKKLIGIGIFAALALFVLSSSVYIVNEDQVAVVKTMGKIVGVVTNSGDHDDVMKNYVGTEYENVNVSDTKGLHFKIPFIQSVQKYSSKYLTYISLSETVNTSDKRQVDISMYAQYRVFDPAIYNVALGYESEANRKMDEEVYPTVINAVNKLEFNEFFDIEVLDELLSERRDEVNEYFIKEFGVYISDIGIHRKTFSSDNISNIEEKMRKEIEKESAQSTAEGDSIYNQKTATVDAQKAQIVADAVEEAAVIKAEADAEAIRTYQEALSVDPEFYEFTQTMDIYKQLTGTTFFLDKNSDIFKFIEGADASSEDDVATE